VSVRFPLLGLIALAFVAPASAGPVFTTSTVGYPPGGEGGPICDAWIEVDAEGRTAHVMVEGCPLAFASRVRESARRWRWEADGSTFVEHRVVRFDQNKPYAALSDRTVLEPPVDALIHAVHSSELKVAAQEPAIYPLAGKGETATCVATLTIPIEGGAPSEVRVSKCDEAFFPAAEAALDEWSFEPASTDGLPSDARWVRSKLKVHFEPPVEPTPLTPEQYAGLLERSEAEVPFFPADGRKHAPAVCQVVATVDAAASVRDVDVEGCHEVFWVAAENVVRRITWAHLDDPKPIRIVEQVRFAESRGKQRKQRKQR
jgi:hypothetical protein